jgi:hypothetical protein
MDEQQNVIEDPSEYLRPSRPSKLIYFAVFGLIALAILYLLRS